MAEPKPIRNGADYNGCGRASHIRDKLVESLHGAGTPQAQRIQIARQMEIETKVGLAKRLAGIDDEQL